MIDNAPSKSVEQLKSELSGANEKIVALKSGPNTAASPVTMSTEPSADETEILRRMEKGLTRQQAADALARQKHYDLHVAPKRRQFALHARSRPCTVNNVG